MDAVKKLENGIWFAKTIKYLVTSGIVVTLYDYMLMLGDEVKYIWKGRKTFIFYLYALNRIILTTYQSYNIYTMAGPGFSKVSSNEKYLNHTPDRFDSFWSNLLAQSGCVANVRAISVLILFMFFSSDIFITLRMYAITCGSKFIGAYFGALALLRFILSLLSSLLVPPTVLDVPPLPIDTSNLCPFVTHPQFKLVPFAIATTFDLSAFVVVAWCAYRHVNTLKFSVVIRTIVAEATIYFLAMVALQVYVQLGFILAESTHSISTLLYAIVNPVLTMRFALSLKRSADSTAQQEWRSIQVASAVFASGASSAVHVSSAREGIEMSPVSPQKGRLQIP